MSVPALCPRCRLGTVGFETTWWATAGGIRRSVWADEPVRCPRGCVLTAAQVARLLVAVYEARGRQLPLWSPEDL